MSQYCLDFSNIFQEGTIGPWRKTRYVILEGFLELFNINAAKAVFGDKPQSELERLISEREHELEQSLLRCE